MWMTANLETNYPPGQGHIPKVHTTMGKVTYIRYIRQWLINCEKFNIHLNSRLYTKQVCAFI